MSPQCTPPFISRWNIPLIPSPLFPALPFPGHPKYMSFFVFGLRSRWETRGLTARWFVLRTSKEHGFVWHQRLKRRRAVLGKICPVPWKCWDQWWTESMGFSGIPNNETPSNGNWLVVSNIFYFHPYLGKIPILTNIFQMGWNHQPGKFPILFPYL